MGKLRRYYSSGQLYSLERFVDGVAHLAQEFYYLDGSLKTMMHYDRGLFDGETTLFWPDGRLKRKSVFSKGEKISDLFYDEGGNPIGSSEAALS